MRRVLLSTVALTALALTGPAAALANHGHHRHHHHHQAKRRGHHARVHFVHLGAGATGTAGTPSPGDTSPTTAPPNENAGKVASYTGGILTLTLNDNSSVSGIVTNHTRIECISASVPPTSGPGEGRDDDNGMGDDQSGSDRNQGAPQWRGSGEHGQDGGDDHGDDGPATTEPPCDSSALVAGAIVREAELRIGPSGTEFESIEIVR
jgi:hypothetical protein